MSTLVKPGDKVIVRDWDRYSWGTVEKVTPRRVYLTYFSAWGQRRTLYKNIFNHASVRPFDERTWRLLDAEQTRLRDVNDQIIQIKARMRELFANGATEWRDEEPR